MKLDGSASCFFVACLSEPASALPEFHHNVASSLRLTQRASKQSRCALYASIVHLVLRIGERCGTVQVKYTLSSGVLQNLLKVFNI